MHYAKQRMIICGVVSLQQDAIAAARKNAIEAGKWIEAEEAAKVWAEELQRVIIETETFVVTTMSRDIADAYGLDWKELSLRMRGLFRSHRTLYSPISPRSEV